MTENQYNELLRAIQKLGRRTFRIMHRGMREQHGLYRGQRVVLEILKGHDGVNQRELAELLDIRPSSMTEMLTRLESKGLVKRTQDENDQRVMRIFLTEEGKTAAQSSGVDDEALNDIFGVLTPEETTQLLALIGKLNAGYEETDAEYGEFPFPGGGRHARGGHPFSGDHGAAAFDKNSGRHGNPHVGHGGRSGRK